MKKPAKAKTVGKQATHAKPAKSKKATTKHAAGASSKKHQLSAAQLAHLHALHVAHLAHLAHLKHIGQAAPAKAKGLALPGEVACCTAQALTASLRLSGAAVSDEDTLDLFWHADGDPDTGAPILATLEAAAKFGLAGHRPVFREAAPSDYPAGLILGVDLPGQHAVLATPDGWWSWGELHCPCEWPDAVVEEAWMVSWS